MWGRPGRLVRAVTRQLEPEWDDASREIAEGLALMESGICPGCGLHESILDDPDHNAFTFESRVCKVCESQERHARVLHEKDRDWEKANPDAKATARRPSDGTHVYLRRMSDAEAAARRERVEERRTRPAATTPADDTSAAAATPVERRRRARSRREGRP